MRRSSIALGFLLFSATAASTAAAATRPAELVQLDALSMAVATDPRLEVPRSELDAKPDRKIVGGLWDRLAQPRPTAVIVVLRSGASGDDRAPEGTRRIAAAAQAFARRAATRGFTATGALAHFPIVFGEVRGEDLLALAELPEVEAIQEDLPVYPARTQGAALMRADQLRSTFGGAGAGVGVAVIDSGVDDTHSELDDRVVAEGDFTGTTGDGTIDQSGHGTAVAGIIAGGNGGLAPAATIWALKVFDGSGSGKSSWVLAALDAAYANRNSFGGLDLVNMSLGGGKAYNTHCDSQFPADAKVVNQLRAAGILTFVASGNDSFANGVSSPACLANVVAVGAVYDANVGGSAYDNCTDSTTAADQVTCYSNSGAPLDLLAPSHCAFTPKPGGYDDCFGGTSAASPYAAAVAAQLLSLRPATPPAALAAAMIGTGKPVADRLTGLVRRRIDALAARQALMTPTGNPPPPTAAPITSTAVPGYRFWVRIGGNRLGTKVNDCVPGTICVAGAIPNRAEVFVRIVGPKANGYLWPNVVKFNTTATEVWIQQVRTGRTRYYRFSALPADGTELPGLVDKQGFLP